MPIKNLNKHTKLYSAFVNPYDPRSSREASSKDVITWRNDANDENSGKTLNSA